MSERSGSAVSDTAGLLAWLRAQHATVAVAESLTGGRLCAALTEPPGASAVVRGGLVVYATDLKARLAGVDEAALAEHGAVHPEIARQLAAGARTRLDATYGIGVTGVAGPEPQDGVAVGTVFAAVAGPTGERVRELRCGGGRAEIQRASVAACLDLLSRECGAVRSTLSQ